MSNKVINSLNLFTSWLDNNGWMGYDPYDIKANKFIINITRLSNQHKIFVPLREFIFELSYTFPVTTRKLLAIKPSINAKAMGLFALAYLDLYKSSKNNAYLEKGHESLQWLIDNKIEENGGIGWGYPFNWQSTKRIPKHTPNGIVTTVAGDAFWNYYKHTGDKTYLDYCIKIARFLNSLPVDSYDGNICFSYTPLFINHVHNLNLFVAEYLIRVGQEVNNQEWVDRGNSAVSYTIKSQLPNGAFDYNGPPEKPQNFIDNYHTGFVLRMLHSTMLLTGREDVKESLTKCYNHYIENFFDNGIPKLKPHQKYRIDIHSSAESINCLSELSVTFPDSIDIANKVLNWTLDNLQDKKGFFYYGILKSRFTRTPFKSKIPYIRWGQAWMLKALSSYYIHNKE